MSTTGCVPVRRSAHQISPRRTPRFPALVGLAAAHAWQTRRRLVSAQLICSLSRDLGKSVERFCFLGRVWVLGVAAGVRLILGPLDGLLEQTRDERGVRLTVLGDKASRVGPYATRHAYRDFFHGRHTRQYTVR